MTAFRSISKSVLAVNPAWWPSFWYDANRPDTRRGRKSKSPAHKCDLCAGRENGPACVENARRTRCNWSLTSHSPAWRNPPLAHRASGTSTVACQYRGAKMPVMSKVEQMQATPARGEPINWRLKRAKPVLMKFICHFARPGTTGSLALP